MPVNEVESRNNQFALKEEMTICHVAALREELLERISTDGDMDLDLSEVAGCDVAGLQLLCAACKFAQQRLKSFRVVKTSPAVSTAIEAAGLNSDEVLGEPGDHP